MYSLSSEIIDSIQDDINDFENDFGDYFNFIKISSIEKFGSNKQFDLKPLWTDISTARKRVLLDSLIDALGLSKYSGDICVKNVSEVERLFIEVFFQLHCIKLKISYIRVSDRFHKLFFAYDLWRCATRYVENLNENHHLCVRQFKGKNDIRFRWTILLNNWKMELKENSPLFNSDGVFVGGKSIDESSIERKLKGIGLITFFEPFSKIQK